MECIAKAVDLIYKNEVELIPNPDSEKSYYSFPNKKDVDEFIKSGKKFF